MVRVMTGIAGFSLRNGRAVIAVVRHQDGQKFITIMNYCMSASATLIIASKQYRLHVQCRCRIKICLVIVDKYDLFRRCADLLQQALKHSLVGFANSHIAANQKPTYELSQPKSLS